jgi:hypothetical protein
MDLKVHLARTGRVDEVRNAKTEDTYLFGDENLLRKIN